MTFGKDASGIPAELVQIVFYCDLFGVPGENGDSLGIRNRFVGETKGSEAFRICGIPYDDHERVEIVEGGRKWTVDHCSAETCCITSAGGVSMELFFRSFLFDK